MKELHNLLLFVSCLFILIIIVLLVRQYSYIDKNDLIKSIGKKL